jgi:DsbC/DsbD-like thiol-disulfide interchange protein
MVMIIIVNHLRPAVAVCAIYLAVGSPAAAEDASRWEGDARSAVRLIAGSWPAGDGAPIRAGIEIRLAHGWHTYWRYPGDAGVPPRFDFGGSQNVKSVEVLWPAPQRMAEAGAVAIGYSRDVILPLVVVPQDRAKPVTLDIKLDYAICEKLCVPAEAKVELKLAAGASSQDAALAAAEARVPKKAALGDGASFAIRAVRREDGGARPRIVVDVAVPPNVPVDLFAEGPTADWALPVPTAVAGVKDGLQRFAFDLDGAPPGAKYQGARITLTAVAGEQAIEVAIHLD